LLIISISAPVDHFDVGGWRVAGQKRWVRSNWYNVQELKLFLFDEVSFIVPVAADGPCAGMLRSTAAMKALSGYFKLESVSVTEEGFCVDIPAKQRTEHGGWAEQGFTFYIGKSLKCDDSEGEDEDDSRGSDAVPDDDSGGGSGDGGGEYAKNDGVDDESLLDPVDGIDDGDFEDTRPALPPDEEE
jgi:hypothetical protein